MRKMLNKWLRKIHRWLVLPTVILMVAIIATRNTPTAAAIQRFQFPLMAIMAVTGLYLWLIPYLVKWSRNK